MRKKKYESMFQVDLKKLKKYGFVFVILMAYAGYYFNSFTEQTVLMFDSKSVVRKIL